MVADLGLISDLVSTPLHGHRDGEDQGERHRGSAGHVHATSGHIKGNLHRRRQADKASSNQALTQLEGPFADTMKTLFARQEKTTLVRLNGKRGKRMLRRAGLVPPHTAPPAASDIFDTNYWSGETERVTAPHYQAAQDAGVQRVDDQAARGFRALGSGSLDQVGSVLRSRSNQLAGNVTDTTYRAITDQLAEGLKDGEGLPQLADRVRGVFHDASANRAMLIARTESHAAMNQAAQTYAQSLPPSIVSRKEWLAHHDERTRPHHRLADGQQVPVSQPFAVGASLMMFPGDPTAPPGEVCNCRCGLAFLPPAIPFPQGATP